MKKFFSIAIAPLMAMMLVACDSDEDIQPAEPKLEVRPKTLTIEASSEKVTEIVTVEATQSWSIASTPDWIQVGNISETGFTASIDPYVDGLTETRGGKIVVAMGKIEEDINIIQKLYIEEIPFVLTVTPDEIIDADPDQVYNITVEASHAWSVNSDAAWITVGEIDEQGFDLRVDAYGDSEEASRTGVVKVISQDEQRMVTVTQNKPLPQIPTIEDYLGQYTVTAKMQSLLAPMLGGFDGEREYVSTGEMTLRPDIGDNVVSIPIFGVEENYDEPTDMFMTFDPETGTLRNNNYVKTGGSSVTCTFAHYKVGAPDWSGWEPKTFYCLEEGSLAFGFAEGRQLAIPAMVEIDGEQKPLAICEFYPASGITWSMIFIYDISMVKK